MTAEIDTAPDLLVVGAGPAGLTAAIEASRLGLSVVLADEKPYPGGQIFAGAHRDPARDGHALIRDFLACGARYLPRTTVWDIRTDRTLFLSGPSGASRLTPRHIILATGAVEKPVPLPGWTLPGVMTAGGGQLLLKTAGRPPKAPVVLAGAGPLLQLLAVQLAEAGTPAAALLDIRDRRRYLPVLRHLPVLAAGGPLVKQGMSLMLRTALAPTPVHHGVTRLCAEGDNRLEAVSFTSGGRQQRIAAATLLLHAGIRPENRLARLLRVEQTKDLASDHWRSVTDRFGRSGHPAVSLAGDGRAILGALAAPLTGRLAALDVAFRLERLSEGERDAAARPLLRRLAAIERQQAFASEFYRPPAWAAAPADRTLVCRCEEITAGRIREEAALAPAGLDALKSRLRCGMGRCQGRYCETVVEACARAAGQTPSQMSVRAPVKPVPLGDIAKLAGTTPTESRIPVQPR